MSSGALLFFALLGLSGCFITCYDRRVRNDLAQPCRELCICCCQPGLVFSLFICNGFGINCLSKLHLLQCVCGLPSSWHSLYVDGLYNMHWRLHKYSRWMRLLSKCRWSRTPVVVHHSDHRTWAIHCHRHILQRSSRNNGWPTDLATALSYSRKANANQSKSSLSFWSF